jgi:phosphopantothenoylcysteine decarboxylase / phosphopantothenate---cysteine ligase
MERKMAEILKDKKILLGISGGIACFKAAELLRLLVKNGSKVRVVMSASATKFVAPLTFSGLGAESVSTDMWDLNRESLEHVSWADWADLFVVAPATGNIIAKMATGIADEVLSTQLLAYDGPVLVAPAMNVKMWQNFATQRNLETLRNQGIHIVGPTSGHLASMVVAEGRMVEPTEIIEQIKLIFHDRADFRGKKIMVTAGPTIEPLDPVRFISNRSSGKMGYAIAATAKKRGAEVVLVSGPVDLLPPQGVKLIRVETARQMQEAVQRNFAATDILIMAAAVADYRPKNIAKEKIKKVKDTLSLDLVINPDILKGVSAKKGNRIIVGFALETEDLLANAKKKLTEKNLDLIVANNPTLKGVEFGSELNQVTIIAKNRLPRKLPVMLKTALADIILDEIAQLHKRKK